MRGTLFVSVVMTFGCALEPGHGFATLDGATFEARYEPGAARDLGNGFLTDQSYAVELDVLSLDVSSVRLESLRTGSGGGGFDPANPPPGYTLCHGGHCHAEDGRLVPYAEVEAELAGGSGGFSTVVTAPIGAAFDLLEPARFELSTFEPSRELPQANVRRIVVELSEFALRATASGASLDAPLELDLSFTEAAEISAPFDLTIDEEGPGAIGLEVTLVVDGTLLDGAELASLPAEELTTPDPESTLGKILLGALGSAEVRVRVEGK